MNSRLGCLPLSIAPFLVFIYPILLALMLVFRDTCLALVRETVSCLLFSVQTTFVCMRVAAILLTRISPKWRLDDPPDVWPLFVVIL
jgi:branched-subunit amino acid permease